jgi:TonB family protein
VGRTEAVIPSSKRSGPDRPSREVATAPSPGVSIVAPTPLTPVAPPVAPIVAPTVAPPPPLTLAKPGRIRPSSQVSPPPGLAPRAVVAPRVSAPPPIAQPVITTPVVTPPRVVPRATEVGRADLQAPKAIAAPSKGHAAASAEQGPGTGSQSGVVVGNTDPALAYYFVLIQDKITSNWAPPKVQAGMTGSVNLSLRVLRSGQVRELGIDTSSGDRAIDDSALRAVRLSSPMPPLPPLFKAESLSLQLRFTLVGEKS